MPFYYLFVLFYYLIEPSYYLFESSCYLIEPSYYLIEPSDYLIESSYYLIEPFCYLIVLYYYLFEPSHYLIEHVFHCFSTNTHPFPQAIPMAAPYNDPLFLLFLAFPQVLLAQTGAASLLVGKWRGIGQ